jgi:peptidoglycan hydrolase CwlO-like protein
MAPIISKLSIMKNRRIFLSFCIFCSLIFAANAQNSLNGQYQQLKEGSNNYQDYKVIKQTTLDAFWSHVQDSVNVNKKKLTAAQQEINAQKAQLTQLQQQIKQRDDQMRKDDEASQQVPVLGISVDKNGYVTFSYVLYAVLLAILAFFFFRYQSSNRVTVNTRKDYEETRQQVDEYKRKLLETQTALGRELQTERNRVDEMQKEISNLRSQMAK